MNECNYFVGFFCKFNDLISNVRCCFYKLSCLSFWDICVGLRENVGI